ncbi:MAG: AAA family ATPase [Lachnospiraceae bacterium]|nr:AAA family ATPase [Lachnospiraceae bacterium]
MGRKVAIGIQNYNEIIENNYFYVDKTSFIKEWWESGDSVTLITRPRRFGKTLTMSMVEQFFSLNYRGRHDLFEGLSIWKEEKFRGLQGTYPVVSLSFANVKEKSYEMTVYRICQLLMKQYEQHSYLRECEKLSKAEKAYFERMASDMNEVEAPLALYQLSDFLCRYHGKKVIILLDEYDTPMQEAYVHGYWTELVEFTRSLFNSTFKTNPWLERAIMTGITRISKESIFSDLNHLEVVTTTSDKYAECFGFTEEEVFAGMDECGYTNKDEVKKWYDGFVFGEKKDIYNPWSILNYLNKGKIGTYWANTSSNSLAGKLVREGKPGVKQSFEKLLKGEHLHIAIDEQIVYSQLDGNERAVWSLFVASGYLKVIGYEDYLDIPVGQKPVYELAITNNEVRAMFEELVSRWFSQADEEYNEFIRALLRNDVESMNYYMNEVALATFSSFDTGKRPSEKAKPERFYHGFVLGLMVELREKYVITSNRESGLGRYDIMLEPLAENLDAIIIEFKVRNPLKEETLEDTLATALLQIENRHYEADLRARGIPKERIRKYGFAFEGKQVLIG